MNKFITIDWGPIRIEVQQVYFLKKSTMATQVNSSRLIIILVPTHLSFGTFTRVTTNSSVVILIIFILVCRSVSNDLCYFFKLRNLFYEYDIT